MKNLGMILAAAGCLAFAASTSASAEMVKIIRHGHPHCHMEKIVKEGGGMKKIIMKRVCG